MSRFGGNGWDAWEGMRYNWGATPQARLSEGLYKALTVAEVPFSEGAFATTAQRYKITVAGKMLKHEKD